ncbi:MAG: hypothetical protein OWQ54_02310 [Sulfolobaceae archaeon]|nr:hypothetical protein [Sulfolobaceae archaeon]
MNSRLALIITGIVMAIVLVSFGIDFALKDVIGVENTTLIISVLYMIAVAIAFLVVFRPIRE